LIFSSYETKLDKQSTAHKLPTYAAELENYADCLHDGHCVGADARQDK